MTWMKVDDKLHSHRKVRRSGTAAMGLWVLAGSWAADNLTDGFVPTSVLLRWGRQADDWAHDLVEAGLWEVDHDGGEDGYRFHDWLTYNDAGHQVKTRQRSSALQARLKRRTDLREAIRRRDADTCRFCGSTLSYKDRLTSSTSGTYEFLDADGPTHYDNIVCCCRVCSVLKDLRPLDETNLNLLPAPMAAPAPAADATPHAVPRYAPESEQGTHPSRSKVRPHDRSATSGTPSRPGPDPSRPVGPGTGRGAGAPATSAPETSLAGPLPAETSAPADFGRRPLPNDWGPNEGHQRLAAQHGLDLATEANVFRATAHTKSTRYANWDVAFTSWLGKARQSSPRVKPYSEMKAQGDALQARLEAIKQGQYPGANAPGERLDEEVLVGEVVTSSDVYRGSAGPRLHATTTVREERRAAV